MSLRDSFASRARSLQRDGAVGVARGDDFEAVALEQRLQTPADVERDLFLERAPTRWRRDPCRHDRRRARRAAPRAGTPSP